MKILSLIVGLSLLISSQAISQINVTSNYTEREVTLKTPTGDLYGSLVIPMENRLGVVALIIPGSGPTDRDGNSILIKGANNSLKMLADSLAIEGISTLRIDKRGIAKSRAALTSEENLRFEDMVEDAVSWLRFLKADKRFGKIAVIGHSEGSLVGMLAAEISDADAFVSIAGAGHSIDGILVQQLSKQLTPELMDTVKQYLATLKKEERIANPNKLFMALFRPSVQPYMISFLKYNPANEIKNVKGKVMLVQGTADLQVGMDEFELLKTSRPTAQTLVIEGMNHVLKQVGTSATENMKSYSDPNFSLAKGLVEGIAQFLTTLEKSRK